MSARIRSMLRAPLVAVALLTASGATMRLAAAPAWGAEEEERGADSVASYTPGTGSGAGYGATYLPGNVLGLPDTAARAEVATTDPKQVLGLGLGGEIVLRFDRHPIVDGPGPDFTVFENAFRYTIGPKERTYAEPGEVSVSRNGIDYVSFPFDSLTLVGCAGVTPTYGDHDPADPAASGGDHFDLAALGIDTVRFVRIRDVTSIVKNNPSHPFWDPTLTGFDLDAVVALNGVGLERAAGVRAASAVASTRGVLVRPNPIASRGSIAWSVGRAGRLRAELFDPLGRSVAVVADEQVQAGPVMLPLEVDRLAPGTYFISISEEGAPCTMARIVVAR